jgi:hypothetical protein
LVLVFGGLPVPPIDRLKIREFLRVPADKRTFGDRQLARASAERPAYFLLADTTSRLRQVVRFRLFRMSRFGVLTGSANCLALARAGLASTRNF